MSNTVEGTMRSIWRLLNLEWRVAIGGKSISSDGIGRYAEPVNNHVPSQEE